MPPKATMMQVPFEAMWPEIPKVERDWWFEVGQRGEQVYFGLHDNWGNSAETILRPNQDDAMYELIKEYLS